MCTSGVVSFVYVIVQAGCLLMNLYEIQVVIVLCVILDNDAVSCGTDLALTITEVAF
jgi:hypothetical protein